MSITDNVGAGAPLLNVGDDTFFTDVDVTNTLGLFSVSNSTIGSLQLGSSGPTLAGTATGLSVNNTITGTRLVSTVATGTAPLTVTSTTQVANLNVEYLAGYRENQIAQNLRSGNQITGGGTVTYNGTGIRWDTRFIVISNGNGTDFSTNGYFDVTLPADGTVITGVGGSANATVAGGYVPLACWHALYYILPIGSGATTVNGNFRIAHYTAGLQVPSTWLLLANQNCDNSTVKFSSNNLVLRANQSSSAGTINNPVFNTSVSSPQLIATVATGTAPLTVTSTTQVNNLNVQYLGGIQATQFIRDDIDGTTVGRLVFNGTSNGQAYNQAPVEIVEAFSAGAGLAPRLAFHYSGSVASQIGFVQGDSSGDIAALNNPGTGYEDFRAATYLVQGTPVIDGSRNIVNAGSGTFAGALNFTDYLNGNSKQIFDTRDSYLRINQGNAFTNGIWLGSSALRANTGGVFIGSFGGDGQIALLGSGADATRRITLDGGAGSLALSGNINTSGVLVAASSLQFGGSANIGFYNDGTNIALRGNNNGTAGIFLQGQGGATTSLYAGTSGTHINRVGIATTTPNYTLDVNGAVNTNSSYKINGVDICTSSGCTATGGASLTANNIFTGVNTFQNAVDITGNVAIGTILTIGRTTGQQVVIASGATNHNIELGRTDGVASSPYIDFHSGSSAVDHDVRIIATGGNGVTSNGTLVIQAKDVQVTGTFEAAKLYMTTPTIGNGGFYACWNSTTQELMRGSSCTSSSLRYKENVVALDDTLGLLGQLRPVSFDWRTSSGMSASNGGLSDYGLIAEEVNTVIPGLVTHDASGQIEGINYTLFAPFLIRAIQQQQSQISMLQQGADLVNGGTINGSLAITGNLNVSGASTLSNLTVTGSANIEGDLTVVGSISTTNIIINGHVITAGDAPIATLNSAFDSNGVNVTIDGNDTTGTVTITTNGQSMFNDPNWITTLGEDGMMLAKLKFARDFGANPRVLVSSANSASAKLGAFSGDEATDSFAIYANEMIAANKTYKFTYWVAQ